jgi:peptidoglycan/xylan/chitin deacetylase (PgdA/CDA1 family)
MSIKLFHVSTTSLMLSIAGSIVFPAFRLYGIALSLLHIPLFVWGFGNIRSGFFGKVRCCKPEDNTRIALTFDDGPDPDLTPEVLSLLKAYEVSATFFLIAQKAKKHPDIVRSIIDNGHIIACHDLNHSIWSNFRMTKQLLNDIAQACLIIKEVSGLTPLFYRPPVGLMNPHVPKAIKILGMTIIGWSKSAKDMGNRNAQNIKKIGQLAHPGDIVMMHDCLPKPELKKEILEAIKKLCASIQQQGLRAVTIDELFGLDPYEE